MRAETGSYILHHYIVIIVAYVKSLFKFIKTLLDLGRGSATHNVHYLAILEVEECRHSGNLVFRSDLRDLFDVNFQELDVLELGLELFEEGGNHLTRTAPGSKEVNDNCAGGNSLFELATRGDSVNHFVIQKISGV